MRRRRIVSIIRALARPRRSRGIALIAVLWTLTLLALAAASFTVGTRTENRIAHNVAENARARALAEAGINTAILAMVERDPDRRWPADGTVRAMRFADAALRVSVQDEAGKIDLNRAPDDFIRGILVVIGVEPEAAARLADAIADYRDRDGLVRLNGAEDDDYARAGLAHGAKDRPFQALEELQQVLGMTPALYRRLAPFVTVHSGRSGIEPRVAPREVLLALPGADPTQIDAEAETPEAADAPALPGLGIPSALLPSLPGLAGVGRRYIARTRNRDYTIRAEARLPSGALAVREAVVRITRTTTRPYRIVAWRDGR